MRTDIKILMNRVSFCLGINTTNDHLIIYLRHYFSIFKRDLDYSAEFPCITSVP